METGHPLSRPGGAKESLRQTCLAAFDQAFTSIDYRCIRRPSGTGGSWHIVPRVSFAGGELHSWLQPAAPLGPIRQRSILEGAGSGSIAIGVVNVRRVLAKDVSKDKAS